MNPVENSEDKVKDKCPSSCFHSYTCTGIEIITIFYSLNLFTSLYNKEGIANSCNMKYHKMMVGFVSS